MPHKSYPQVEVTIDKLVHGGQGIGTLDDGRKIFVWNGLPGERLAARLTKSKKDYAEGVATEIIGASPHRQEPKDESYLSTSPWQIMDYDSENEQKLTILKETFDREGIELDGIEIKFQAPKSEWQYRNKMEYSFYGDDCGLHLALFNRGTHSKQIVTGSSIARPEIDGIANKICGVLDNNNVRAGDLKSLILRSNQKGEVVCALFAKNEKFPNIKDLDDIAKGIVIVYSNPRSPASVRTRDLYQFGDITLNDELNGKSIKYDVFSFFQVNLEIFNQALSEIKKAVGHQPVVDIYSGVGTIGLSMHNPKLLIEIDDANAAYADENSAGRAEVVQASSEKVLDYITADSVLIVDPPRAGLHKDLIQKINDVKPPMIIYLSCNPSTQSRDVKLLVENYDLKRLTGYNFFPRTPHIESLAILVRK